MIIVLYNTNTERIISYPAEQGEVVKPLSIPAQDAYMIGDKVHFPTILDPVYQSLVEYSVWSPLDYPIG